jgi:hypothetical protein
VFIAATNGVNLLKLSNMAKPGDADVEHSTKTCVGVTLKINGGTVREHAIEVVPGEIK